MLNEAQLRSALGAELLSLCQTITKDGRLSDQEVAELRAWLAERESDDLPALVQLRATLDRVMDDGRITADEYLELYRAVESVLPPEARREPVVARQAVRANFMLAGVRCDGRPTVIQREVTEGLDVRLKRDARNEFSPNAIAVLTPSGREIGFVPEDYAGFLAPLLDGGAKHRANVRKILGRAHVPVPVVEAYLYGWPATLAFALANPGSAAIAPYGWPSAYARDLLFYIGAVALAVALVVYLGLP